MTAYTGDVTVGGPADVAELETLTVRKLAVSPMNNNAYLLTCRATGAQLLIDAAAEPTRLLDLVRAGGDRLDEIVTTHQHPDHTGALVDVANATGARTWAGAADAEALPLAPDQVLEHGDAIVLGDLTLEVVHLRGHTPGSIAVVHTEPSGAVHIFSGDSLFPGGVGATTMFEYQSFESLIEDVTTRIFDVYEDAHVYPGHGADTTLAAERPHLDEWRQRGW
ncbi:MBL fold metallo-hydrolase [Kribbia dieselivorans]|uniref:MBL fold metallo-hydrolase n=1 Tax=Kribbia dieselivorans TaxID=331526 RepID=UPI000839160A|nr:MBL fold metallo-hydrolase [Kribbia dieselivorans]